jgi:hypothetical protein
MQTFRLKLKGDDVCAGKEIEFEGGSPLAALEIIATERHAEVAELWSEGQQIFELVKARSSSWQIAR